MTTQPTNRPVNGARRVRRTASSSTLSTRVRSRSVRRAFAASAHDAIAARAAGTWL